MARWINPTLAINLFGNITQEEVPMAARRVSMPKVRELLRLRLANGMSIRQIAGSCNIGKATVQEYLLRARVVGLGWPLPEGLDDGTMERMLYPTEAPARAGAVGMPPMEEIHRELRRKGVTLELLWQEYKARCPDGYGYSRFCQLYGQWEGIVHLSFRQSHRAGEKVFVDWAGQRIPVVDPQTGQIREVFLLVALSERAIIPLPGPSLPRSCPTGLGRMCRPLSTPGESPRSWSQTTQRQV